MGTNTQLVPGLETMSEFEIASQLGLLTKARFEATPPIEERSDKENLLRARLVEMQQPLGTAAVSATISV